MKYAATIFLLVLCLAPHVLAGERGPVVSSPKDKCPVCGMFVTKFPDWTSQIILKDGSYAVFDGAKDMFKYYLHFRDFNPSHSPADIDSIYVMDYYSMRLIEGFKADFVLGSDVYGPMGHELVAFANSDDAKEFMKDHKGKRILKFNEITAGLLKELD